MSPTPTSSADRLILPIQYLRGIAALMVVWFHGMDQVPGLSRYFPFPFGASGVDLFFVISGFIMVTTTWKSAPTPLEFMRRRVIRIVPLYWLLTLAMVSMALCVPNLFRTLVVTPRTLVESLLFIPHFSISFPFAVWPLLVPGWTLNYEMFFYLVFACALLLPARMRLTVMAGVLGTLVAIGFALGPFDSAIARVYLNPLLLEFVIGTGIGAWWSAGRPLAGTGASLVLLVAGFAGLTLRDHPPLGVFTQMAGAALMVVGALNSTLARWQCAPLRALGDSSYSLYLTHLFALGVLRVIWGRFLPPIESWWNAAAFQAAGLVTASVAGWLTFRFVETPMLRWLNRRTGARRQADAVAAMR